MEMHYNEDLSLGEIAERTGITRQGAHDALKRSAEVLERCEEKLKLLDRYQAVKRNLDELDGILCGKSTLDAVETEMLKAKLREASDIWEGNDGL